MSRSNGYEPNSGAVAQPGTQQQQPAAGFGQPGAYQTAAPQLDAYGQPIYAQPGYTQPNYAQQSGYQPQQQVPVHGYGLTPQPAAAARGTPQNYAPKFDAYVPPSQGQPAAQQYQAPVQSDLRGAVYDQWATQGQQQAQAQQQSLDPRGFDLSSYSQPGYGQAPQPQAAAYGTQYGYQQAPAQEYASPQQGYVQEGEHQQEYAEHDEDFAEEPPRRSRGFMIAAALAGAIFVGGGLTYAYSSLLGGSSGPTPLVKSAEGPSKVKPAEPGGKQFAHSDSKVLGRLSENGAPESDPSGAKKVATLVVKPDGSIAPPAAAPAEPVAAVMPGMSVVNVGGPSPAQALVETASTAPAAEKPLVVSPPVAPPKAAKAINAVNALNAAASGPAPVAAAPVATAALAPAAPAVVKKAEAPKKVAATTETIAKAAAPVTTPTPVSTGTGYMAVVASMPATNNSRVGALARWADMQQKYGSILSSKQPDVQEANLGEKGTYHRLLVGPPGSKDGANSVCTQLKAAGHPDCWVMAF